MARYGSQQPSASSASGSGIPGLRFSALEDSHRSEGQGLGSSFTMPLGGGPSRVSAFGSSQPSLSLGRAAPGQFRG